MSELEFLDPVADPNQERIKIFNTSMQSIRESLSILQKYADSLKMVGNRELSRAISSISNDIKSEVNNASDIMNNNHSITNLVVTGQEYAKNYEEIHSTYSPDPEKVTFNIDEIPSVILYCKTNNIDFAKINCEGIIVTLNGYTNSFYASAAIRTAIDDGEKELCLI